MEKSPEKGRDELGTRTCRARGVKHMKDPGSERDEPGPGRNEEEFWENQEEITIT